MNTIIDEIVDTVVAYRQGIGQRDKQLQELAEANRTLSDRVKERDEIIKVGKADNERLRGLLTEAENKLVASEAGKLSGIDGGKKKSNGADQPVQ